MRAFAFFFVTAATILDLSLQADTVNLISGDRFTGSVELVNAAEVQLKSDALGVVRLSRAKVASIYFGTNQPSAKISGLLNKDSAAPDQFDPKAVERVQEDFLATAGPEANAMFKDLIQGLASGKLNVEDIRNQARESLKELKELQGEVGEEADNPLIQSYVGILEQFINKGSTNKASATPAKKPNAPVEKPAEE